MNRQLALMALPLASLAALSQQAKASEKPNIIYILADDLGYGDLSCYGQEHFQTPNIDKLAQDGILFTQHYAGSAVSAPSRSTLLTGQHTGYTPIRGNKPAPNGEEGQWHLPSSSNNVMKMLKEEGYATGVFGKWGLGSPGSEGDPNNQGVDEFYGFNCQRLAHHYYPYHLWHNQEKVILKGNKGQKEKDYSPALIHDVALDFIKDNKEKPFFMYYASILPHAELRMPKKDIDKFRKQFAPEKAHKGLDGGKGYREGRYGSAEAPHATFAAMVTKLDDQVGEIVALLKKLGLEDNTIIVFSSDNGPHNEGGADPKFFDSNGPLRGIKRDLYEGGIRVPLIAKWPNKIKAGTTSDHVSAFWDFMPTVADMLDLDIATPINGISYLPSLTGEGDQEEHASLYWELHEKQGKKAIRKGDWKGVILNVKGESKMELYNLKDDLGETRNVADANPHIVKELEKEMKQSRTESEYFNFVIPTFEGN